MTHLRLVLPAAIACLSLFAPGATAPAMTQEEADAAFVQRVINSLTVDERVGQLVMVNFVGNDVSPESDVAGLVRDFHVGAVHAQASNGNIVNSGDTAAQLTALTNGLQQRAYEASARTGPSGEFFLPLFISTDNEGDLFPFTNVTHNYTQLPNNMTIGATFSNAQAEAAGRIAGRELSAAGINLLLGPVVDVLDNPRSGGAGDIGIRSFSGSAPWVGSLGRAYVRGVHEGSAGRMLTVAKHFPGHGGSDRSTDNEVPTVNKSLAQLRALELAPFADVARIDDADPLGTTDAMMVSHIRYRNFADAAGGAPFTRPISLDAAAFRTLMDLPEFAGWRSDHLVMADSLGVIAVKTWYAEQEGQPAFPNRTVVREALLAGNDLLPMVEFYADASARGWRDYQLPVIQDSILYMREQYASDVLFQRRADEALRHVISAKVRLYPGLTLDEVLRDGAVASEVAGSGADEMRALNDAALTLVQPPSVGELRARLPRGPLSPDKVVIVECWNDCYPYRVMPQADLENHLLRLYGPDGAGRLQAGDVQTISFAELDAWLESPDDAETQETGTAVNEASWLIFALAEYNPNGFPASGAVKRFLDGAPVDLRNKNLVAIAYNVPYHLDSTEISKLAAYFAVYNKTDYAIETGFRALYGDIEPRGRSPVDINGIFYDVDDATEPEPSQTIAVSVYGSEPDNVPSSPTIALIAGPVLDRNGNVVPDGTGVSFALTKTGGAPVSALGETSDGIAAAQVPTDGAGAYTATASVGGATSEPLALQIGESGTPEIVEPPAVVDTDDGGSGNTLVLVLAIGVPSAAVAVGAAAGGIALWRRRSRRELDAEPVPPAVAPEPLADAPPAVLRVDGETRRVYVKGVEARPGLSNEQFRLLSYLYERAGKVVPREELVRHVWPDAHSEGVSEEALDALVRRVRERIAQAGGERSYIVTLRGQGFRLEI
jgi:beta-N-acetylhexosaminidase